jgi:hypothetical protein
MGSASVLCGKLDESEHLLDALGGRQAQVGADL